MGFSVTPIKVVERHKPNEERKRVKLIDKEKKNYMVQWL